MAMTRDDSATDRTDGVADRRMSSAADKQPVQQAAAANNYKHHNPPPAAANNNKHHNPPAADPSKSRHGGNGGGAVTFANVQRQTAGGGSNVDEVPLLFVNKHRNQYDIQMNPMPYRNQDGEWVRLNNVEPIIVKLAKRDAQTLLSSQSSMEFEVMPRYDKSAKQCV